MKHQNHNATEQMGHFSLKCISRPCLTEIATNAFGLSKKEKKRVLTVLLLQA